MKKAYGDTHIATINLPSQVEKTHLHSKIRVGWIVCRLREQISVRKWIIDNSGKAAVVACRNHSIEGTNGNVENGFT